MTKNTTNILKILSAQIFDVLWKNKNYKCVLNVNDTFCVVYYFIIFSVLSNKWKGGGRKRKVYKCRSPLYWWSLRRWEKPSYVYMYVCVWDIKSFSFLLWMFIISSIIPSENLCKMLPYIFTANADSLPLTAWFLIQSSKSWAIFRFWPRKL